MSEEEKLHFAIVHLGKHYAKTAGKIVAETEEFDHTQVMKLENLKIDVAKSLLNTLRLASLVGINGAELEGKVKEYVT